MLVPLVLGVLFVIVYAFFVNLMLGSVIFFISIVLFINIYFLSRKISNAQKEIAAKMAVISGSVTETLRNIELVKGMGLEDQEINRNNVASDKLLQLQVNKIKLSRRLDFIQGILVNFSRLIVLLVMLLLIYDSSITLGEFFSILFYISFIFAPLSELGIFASQYLEATVGLKQLENVLNLPSNKSQNFGVILHKIESLLLENVSFSYSESSDSSIKDISFFVSAGGVIAFVGPSGCGKTTLIKILVGLYVPDDGRLLYNNQNSNSLNYNELRQKIGLVSQETQLFAGSIRENLLFVRSEATDSECLEVLKNTLLLGILERGDQGLDTIIGEGGMKLSGGERQRLAIARALLRHPDMLIFDEATSSLDSFTEKEIIQTINFIKISFPEIITVIIAHRLSAVIHVDKIYVMDEGRIIESGNHGELIKKNGSYASLWREQTLMPLNNKKTAE